MAADASTVVARVGLDDRGFQEGISKLQRSLKVVQSEFAAASSKLGDFGKSTEGLRLKADTLNKQIDLQRQKVEALNKGFQDSVAKKGEDAKATENLKIKLNYAIAELNKMESELRNTTNELNEKSSAWYKLSQSMDKASEKMKNVGDKMSSVGSKLTAAITVPIFGIGVASTKMAMDAVESENLFEVSMGKMAGTARQWSEDISKSLGLNAYSVRSNVATYNAMMTSMGLTSQESLKVSQGLTQLSYDMASFYNLKPEEAFEKLKSGISGEAEPLKALGILVNDTTVKTYAYANGIAKQGAELTEQQKVMARYGAIMDATKNAQGDLARTMDSPTNKLRTMKEQAAQISIQFGQLLIPVLEKLIAVIKPLLDRFNGMSKEQQESIIKIGLVVAAIGPLLLIIGKLITVVSTIISIFSAASGAIAAAGGVMAVLTGPVGIVIAAIAALIAIGVLLYKNWDIIKAVTVAVWESIKNFFSGLWEGLKAFFAKWGDELLIVIAPFIGIPLYIYKNWDAIKEKLSNIWNGIKDTAAGVWNGIGKTVQGVINGIIKGINFMIRALNNLSFDVPDWVPGIGGSTFGFNIPEIREVNWYASGGIFNRPSVIGVGEAGTEAVLPIDRLDELMVKAIDKSNKNTGSGAGLIIQIEKFINNTEKDIEQLAYELEFYRQRIAMGRGGT